MQKGTNPTAIIGYFSAQGEIFKKGMLVTIGRSGIHYQKEDLIGIIHSNPVNPATIDIIEISIPAGAALLNPGSNIRFGIKSGKPITVTDVNPLVEKVVKTRDKELVMA